MKTVHHFAPVLLCLIMLVPCSAEQPNIVLIVADDLGYGDLGCYGSKTNRTPHIDNLAASGIRFTDFHSAGPMCSPTRASIMTGRYQQRIGRLFDGPLSGELDRHTGLPHSTTTIAELLKSAGYATACFGKWHLGFEPPWLPTRHGFEEFRGLAAGDGDHHTHVDRYGNEDWWHNESIEMEAGYTADLLTKYSVDFIERNTDKPFFLYVPHLAIHFPWQGPKDPPHRVAGKDYKEDKWGVIPNPADVAPHVKAMVEAIDSSTGAILATLARHSLREKTIVVFTSDNGGYTRYGKNFTNISSNASLRGQKGTLYEGGHRVPMIVSWEGKISPTLSSATTHTNDLLPTFASLASVEVPDLLWPDGMDLSGLMLRGTELPNRTLFWRAGKEWAARRGPWTGRHATARSEGEQKLQLFDLSRDISEQHDVSAKKPEIVTRLATEWNLWNSDMPK